MIARIQNIWAALVFALSRDCGRQTLEDAHRRIGELIKSGVPVEAIRERMAEEDWKQQIRAKKEAIRVDLAFTIFL